MYDILISSPAFNNEKSNQYILSIQISLDGFSFSVCDSISNKFIYLSHKSLTENAGLVEQIKATLNSEKSLNLSYKNVYIALDLKPSTLVPKVLFNEEKKHVYYAKNYKIEPNSSIIADEIKLYDSVNLYTVDDGLLQLLNTHFGTPKISHFNSIKTQFITNNTDVKHTVYLTIRDTKFSITVLNAKTIVLQNSYSYSNVDEFLYFFLYCFNQLNLDQLSTSVEIDGILPKHSTLVKELERFIKNVSFANWPESHNFANDFYDMPSHYFTYLYQNILCE